MQIPSQLLESIRTSPQFRRFIQVANDPKCVAQLSSPDTTSSRHPCSRCGPPTTRPQSTSATRLQQTLATAITPTNVCFGVNDAAPVPPYNVPQQSTVATFAATGTLSPPSLLAVEFSASSISDDCFSSLKCSPKCLEVFGSCWLTTRGRDQNLPRPHPVERIRTRVSDCRDWPRGVVGSQARR